MKIVCLHYLGGSGREFGLVANHLGDRSQVAALDLPGFGAARDVRGYSIADMVAYVAGRVEAMVAGGDWFVVGHSMGAKVAAVLARFAEDGAAGLAGLKGLISLAGSPPGPEPMDEAKRDTMLTWFQGDSSTVACDARTYIQGNVAQDLPAASMQLAEEDVLQMHPDAWRAWLEHGSREDWRSRVGMLQLPALIVAGDHDEALGASAQMEHALPHYAYGRLQTLSQTGHLLPLERAERVAELIKQQSGCT